MNEQSSGFPGRGTALSYSAEATPALTGLRALAIAPVAAKPEQKFDLQSIWRMLAKWWWLIAAITLACLLGAIAFSLLVTPEYRAEATIEVNPEAGQMVKMGNAEPIQMGDREFLTTQVGLLKSRSLAERVVRTLNLGANPEFANPEAPRAQREMSAASALRQRVTVAPQRDSRLIEIQVEDADPELAARIANSYADGFIQSSLERRFEATAYARDFLEQRIATVKKKLEDSERQLVDYAQKQGIITLNVDSGNGAGGRSEQSIDAASLVSLNAALSAARSDRIAAEQQFRQSSGAQATASVISNPTVQALQQQRSQLEAEYQEKLGVFKPEFPAMAQLRNRIDTLGREIARQSRSVASSASGNLRADYAAAVARENALERRVNSLKQGLLNLRQRSIQYTILQREVDTNRSLYDALLQRFKEVGVAGGVGANAVSVVDRAEPPQAPFTPNLPLNIGLGLFLGLILGFGTAFALEWIDDTIKTPDDLTNKLKINPLGVIPKVGGDGDVRQALEDARSQVSEAYQSVRAALQFATDHGIPKTLLISSTRAAEGKSSTALAISQTLARLGANVLLLDADLRKPTFRGPSSTSAGLSTLLAGSGKIEEATHPTGVERLFLLPSGPIPPNPAELLSTDRFAKILGVLSEQFDFVVIDGPPVLGLADAPLLSSTCEGTVMIIESGGIRRAAALNAVNRLRSAGAKLMGGILTKFDASKSGYGYGYGYGYGEEAYAYAEGDKPKKQIELLKS